MKYFNPLGGPVNAHSYVMGSSFQPEDRTLLPLIQKNISEAGVKSLFLTNKKTPATLNLCQV